MRDLVFIMILGGILGGTVNFVQLHSEKFKGFTNYFKCVILGLGGSSLVPLILQVIGSNVMETAKQNSDAGVRCILVLFSFCVIAATFSKRFIASMGENLLHRIDAANLKADEAKELNKKTQDDMSLIMAKKTERDGVNSREYELPNQEKLIERNVKGFNEEDEVAIETAVGYSGIKGGMWEVLKAIRNSDFLYRTCSGITKQLDYNPKAVINYLTAALKKGYVCRKIGKDKSLWAITQEGLDALQKWEESTMPSIAG